MTPIIAVLMVAAWVVGAGGSIQRVLRLESRHELPELRWLERSALGLLAFHLLVTLLDLGGVGWERPTLIATGAATLAALLLAARRRTTDASVTVRRESWRWRPGDAAALAAIAGFGAAAYTLSSPFSDFVYHWGLKAHRFFLYGGIDYSFLSRPENGYLHPDYPHLVPEITAISASLAGRFAEPALMLVSPLFVILIWLGLRAAARSLLPNHSTATLLAGALTLALTAFAIGYHQAGSADLPFAFALLLGALGLLDDRPRRGARLIGLAAGLAACTKIEGVPLAALLVLLAVLRWWRGGERHDLLRRIGLATAPLLVSAPWAISLIRYDLLQRSNSGSVDLSRLASIGSAALEALRLEPWHGFAWLLLLSPLLLLTRSTRWLAALCLGQLAFYLWIYVSAPLDPEVFVRTSLPRLLLHVAPPLWLGLFAVLAERET